MNLVKPTYSKVSLMIYGNPQSAAGYQPIFYINDPRFTPPIDLSPAGMAQNDHYFVVNISQAFVNIVLIQNNVKSAGASREGILKFAMAVPKGYRLANGKTPYDFLMDVRNAFMANYMDQYGSGWQFKSPLPGPQIIQQVVDKYAYEPAVLPHRQMRGQAQGFLATNQIAALFTDLQYPEFERFREIVVGEHSTQPSNVGNIAIPRRPQWKLMVNGQRTQWPVRDIYTEPVNIIAEANNPRYFEPAKVTFTVNEARQGKYPEVSVDEVNEVVNVRLEHKPRRRVVRVKIEGAQLSPSDFADIDFRVGGRKVVVGADNQILLQGVDIDKPVTADYEGRNYTMKSFLQGDTLTLKMQRKQTGHAGGFQGGYAGGGNVTPGKTLPLTICIAREKASAKLVGGRVTVEQNSGRGFLKYSESVGRFETVRDTKRGNSEFWQAEISLPAVMAGNVRVVVKTNLGKYEERHYIAEGENRPVMMAAEPIEKRNAFNEMLRNPGMAIAMAVVALILGAGIYWALNSFVLDKEKDSEQNNVIVIDERPDAEWWLNPETFGKMSTDLDRPEVSFSQIEQFKAQIDALEASDSEEAIKAKEENQTLIDKIKQYATAVNAIKSADVESLQEVKLNDVHQHMISEALEGWYDGENKYHEYTQESRVKARQRFTEKAHAMQQFEDFVSLHNGLPEYPGSEAAAVQNANASGAGNSSANKNNRNNGKLNNPTQKQRQSDQTRKPGNPRNDRDNSGLPPKSN